MRKKAQTGQIIIYISAIIVIGTLIIIGGKLTYNLLNKQCDLTELNLQTKINSLITENSRWGAVNQQIIRAPCDAEKMCFINNSIIGNQDFKYDDNKIIEASIKDGIKQNVFLVMRGKEGRTIPVAYNEKIRTKEEPITCIEAKRGSFSFFTKGLGKEGVEISK